MNKEIKEILDYLDYGINNLCISKPPFKIEYEDIKKLLDYITNLQEENKHLERQLDMALSDYENYRDRCDRAIEYIKNELYILGIRDNRKQQDELLNILKGEDKDVKD